MAMEGAQSNSGRDASLSDVSTWLAVAILICSAALIWLPAMGTPFWGDDYSFLLGAHAANLEGASWWSPFHPENASGFWRPLSEESWWRFVDGTLGADPRSAHWANLALLAFAAICVGLLGLSIASACGWQRPIGTAFLSGCIYGVLALHFLPVHWASAANSSILVVLTSLLLAAWIAARRVDPVPKGLLLASIPVLLVAALLSKESAALIPLLMIVLSLFVEQREPDRFEAIAWLVSAAIVVAWLLLRTRVPIAADSHYDLRVGANLFRNGFALIAWLLNVPREAMRLVFTGNAGLGILWSALVALPMAAVWMIAVRKGLRHFGRRRTYLVLAFCALAYASYFLLAWNSYAYYAAIAAILPTVVLAQGLAAQRLAVPAALLIGLSSWIGVAGSRQLPNPALIARAQWAEAALVHLENERIGVPLFVRADDPQRFHAIGVAGLAWRLDLDPKSIRIVSTCPHNREACLVIRPDGQFVVDGAVESPMIAPR